MGLTVLDGGMGHLLKSRAGIDFPRYPMKQQFTAGVLANVDHPEQVTAIHREYLEAGSTVITTNSFNATPYSLKMVSMLQRLEEFVKAAAECAKAAVAQANNSALIAGSVPPLMNCYTVPSLTEEEMDTEYQTIVKALEPHVDLLLWETLSSVKEAQSATRISARTNLPYWISFTLEDSLDCKLRSGESFQEAVVELFDVSKQPEAILVNCCAPKTITSALKCIGNKVASQGIQYGGYANAFKQTTSSWLAYKSELSEVIIHGDYDDEGIITSQAYCRHAQQWMELGASVIGGCCGTTPSHIQKIAELQRGQ